MHTSSIILDSITNTKIAAALYTLGFQLAEPGVFITYDKDNPKSSGGQAHFLFKSSLSHVVEKAVKTYNEGVADEELDEFLDSLRECADIPNSVVDDLEKKIHSAIIVYERKALNNYQVMVRDLKNKIAKHVVTGGTPVYGKDGELAGIEGFSIRRVE